MRRLPLWAAGLLLLAGCAFTGQSLDHRWPDHLPPRKHLDDVPFLAQTVHQCGPAALAMVLQWSGEDVLPDELTPEVFTPGRKGSLQAGLITAARRHQRLAYPIFGLDCLLEAVASGRPVIVLQNLGLSWLPRWHYAVVVGYDLPEQQMILHTGKIADRSIGFATFDRTWQRADQWGLLVLAAEQIPVCAEEQSYLQAALGLQQAGHTAAAVTAFRTAVGRWPESTAARTVLGNALYENGDKDAAVEEFRRAVQLDPSNGAALNNLAHILAEQGSMEAAEAAAQRAVLLGGPHASVYRQTLEEIRQRKRP